MKKIKARSSDYQYSDLPKNRTQVFFDVIKNQWRKLMFLGLLLLIAFLPYITIIFFRDNYVLGISKSLSEGAINKVDAYKLFCVSHLIAAGASWLSFYFTAFILGGVVRIIRQLVWGEPVFLKEDLVIGGKQNYRFGAILATFFGGIIVLSSLMYFATDNQIIQHIPLALFIAFLVPPLLITYMEGTIYNGSFRMLFHNAVLMYIKKAPHALLFTFILLSPILFRYIESFLVLKYILIVVVVFFILVLLLMMFYLFSCYLFDIYINPQLYPEMMRKGLGKED